MAAPVVVPIPIECTSEEVEVIVASLRLAGILSGKPGLNSTTVTGGVYWTALAPGEAADNHGLNLAFIRFTSGTTSARKGVAFTHETILARITTANRGMGIGPQDTVIWCLPMSHHFLVTIVLYLQQGAAIVLSRLLLARSFLETVNRWSGTVLYASPFQFGLLARDDSKLGLDSVRLAVSTTASLSEDVACAFRERFGRPLWPALGIIELGLVSLNSADPTKRWNSVGKPLPGFEARIINPDEAGNGELAIRGPGLFDAYAEPWLPSERVAPGGWFATGDIAKIDAEGFIFLLSRINAVINLAGRKVFPEEIEAVLNQHPSVRESRAYGRAHPHLGEIVEAEIVFEDGGAELDGVREYCRARLASYKIPSRWHVVQRLPRTAVTGKLRREVMAA